MSGWLDFLTLMTDAYFMSYRTAIYRTAYRKGEADKAQGNPPEHTREELNDYVCAIQPEWNGGTDIHIEKMRGYIAGYGHE